MFEAYSVAVTLRMNNLVSPHLAGMARDVAALQKEVGALNAAFANLDRRGGFFSATEKSAASAAASVRSTTAAANESTAAFTRASAAAAAYRNELLAQRGAASMGARTPPVFIPPALPPVVAYPRGAVATTGGGQGGSIPPLLTLPPRGGAAGGSGGMPYTPYTMRTPPGGGMVPPGGGMPPGGGAGGGGAGAGGAVYGAAPMRAILPLAAAAGTIYGAKALYESARDYETAATRFKTLNLGDAVNKEAEKFARGTKVFGVSSADLMETLRESVGMFGSMPNALQVAPVLAQLNAANSNLFGGKIGKIDDHAVRALMRFNDMRGLTDSPKDFMRGLDLAQRMVTGSGGSLNFAGLEQLAKRGGAAFKGLNDDGVMMLSTLAQEQGGATTGTALMSLYQNLIAGRTTKKAMAALEAAGLVTLDSVSTGTVGGKKSKSTVISGVKEEKLLRENPGMWLMTVGLDAAKKTGAKTDSEIISVVNSWLSNRTGSNMAANFTTQSLQAMRDFKLAQNAAGVDQTIALNQKGASGKEGEFIAAWSNFKTEFGSAALPAFTNLLTGGANFLRSINGFMASPSTKSFIAAYEGGFKAQGNFIGKTVDTLFGAKPGAPEVRTGAAVAGNDTAGGAFTGFRSPIRTSAAGAGRGMINNVIVMPNGRELARVVTQEQGKELSRPQTGPRTADGRQSLRAFDTERGG